MRALSPFILLCTTVAFLTFYVLAMPVMMDPDVPWHIMAGNAILSTHHIPTQNGWAFTEPDHPWFNLSWLWDVKLSVLHSVGGLPAIFILSVFVMSVVIGLIAGNIELRGSISNEAKLLAILVVILGMFEFVSARPHLAGYVLVVLIHQMLHRSRESQHRRLLYSVPVIMALWANLHGSFIAGFTLIGAYALEALFIRDRAWLKLIVTTLLVSVVGIFVNPYGAGVISGIMGTLASSNLGNITEWGHFVFGKSIGLSMWVLIFLISFPVRDRRAPLADQIISVAWFSASLWSFRNAAIFVLVSVPYVALNLHALLVRFEHIRTHRPDPLLFLIKPCMQEKLALLFVAVVVAATLLLPVIKGDRYRIDSEKDPGKAIAYVLENLKGKRVLNDFDYGGRIVYESGAQFPVFIDPRFGTAYSEGLINEYVRFLLMEDGWEEVLKKYRIQAILIGNESRFAISYAKGEHHEHWKEVYRDSVAGVYVKK